ncbi:hypothetical protein [Salinifilum ghardaiensis]
MVMSALSMYNSLDIYTENDAGFSDEAHPLPCVYVYCNPSDEYLEVVARAALWVSGWCYFDRGRANFYDNSMAQN